MIRSGILKECGATFNSVFMLPTVAFLQSQALGIIFIYSDQSITLQIHIRNRRKEVEVNNEGGERANE